MKFLFTTFNLVAAVAFISAVAKGQTTVFSDNFNRASLTTGAPTTYTTTVTAGDGGASINGSSFLEITNDSSGTANANGITYISGQISSFSSPFSSTSLASNSGVITWTFNLRFNRASSNNPAQVASGAYGVAVVLAGTNSSLAAGSGYAIYYGNSGTPDPIRLATYSGGVAGTVTNVITSGASDITNTNNYASVKVTYNPTGNLWSLFVRDDGASAWSDPSSGVTSQKGSTTANSTVTSTALSSFGYAWSYATGANQTSQFDNFSVSVSAIPEPSTYAAIFGSLALAGTVWHRRRQRKAV